MYTAKVTSKGQITLPKGLRDELKIHPGDEIQFLFKQGKAYMLNRSGGIADLKGLFPDRCKTPKTLEKMEEGIAEGALESMK